jgi:flagellar FliL protein
MYPLDAKAVNLAEPGGLRYLQASIVLEFRPMDDNYYQLTGEARTKAETDFKTMIDARRPVIDDITMTLLSSKSFNDIATVDGKQALKKELITAINDALGYQGVINIYFTAFIVQ